LGALRASGLCALPREARLVLAMTTLFGFAYGGIGLLLRPLYVLRLNLGAAYFGLYSALGSLAFMAGSMGAGWAGSRLGARKAMLIGAIACSLGSLFMPLTESLTAAFHPILPIISNLVLSAAWAYVSVNTVPALTAVTADSEHDRVIGLSNTLNGLGVLVGNLLGGLLPRTLGSLVGATAVPNVGFRLALTTAPVLGLGVVGLLLALPRRRMPEGDALSSTDEVTESRLPLAPLLVFGLFSLFIPAAASAVSTYAAPYLDQELHLSTEAIGVVTTLSQALAVVGMGITPWLARLLTSRRGDILTAAGIAITLLPMAAIAHWSAAVFSRVVSGALNTIRFPLTQMYAMAQVPQEHRPLLSGLLFTGAGLCGSAVSYMGGRLAASQGYRAVFWVSAGVTLISVGLYSLATRVLTRKGYLVRA